MFQRLVSMICGWKIDDRPGFGGVRGVVGEMEKERKNARIREEKKYSNR